MSRLTTKSLIVALALGAAALSGEPAAAAPTAGAGAIAQAAPVGGTEQVYFYRRGYYRRPFFRRRYYGYRRPFYRRGLPGHPIRRLLRAL